MKIKLNIFYPFLGLVLLISACSPNKYELGSLMAKSALKFKVTADSQNPNMIILESLTPNVTPLWKTPLGLSQRVKDTIIVAFPGTYTINYGVESDGGYVEADPYTLTITTIDADYVSDPLWTMLAGGLGNQKIWYLDLDANGKSKFFAGPEFFYGTNDSWESVTNGVAVGGDSWNWCPDWPGNSWLMAKADFGSMTFDLKGGVHVVVNNKTIPALGIQTGNYMLYPTAHTLKMTNAGILHDIGSNGMVKDWGDVKVMSLTTDHMQLAALRDPVLSGQGACLLVYNFVSKAYYDSH